MFEKQTEFDQNNNKSGTTSAHKLYHYMEFMLQFLRKLVESLEKNESFKATDKVTIYQVDKAHESSFFFIVRNGGFGRVMFSLVSICPRGEGLGWVAMPGPMSLGVVCLVPCPFGGMPGPMSLLGWYTWSHVAFRGMNIPRTLLGRCTPFWKVHPTREVHPPGADIPFWPLKWAVCILLEYCLVI